MKLLIKVFVLLGGIYCVAMFGIATWSMFMISISNRNVPYDDTGVVYSKYYLLVGLSVSIATLLLQGLYFFWRLKNISNITLNVILLLSWIAIFICFVLAFGIRILNNELLLEIIYSSTPYLLMVIINSLVLNAFVWDRRRTMGVGVG